MNYYNTQISRALFQQLRPRQWINLQAVFVMVILQCFLPIPIHRQKKKLTKSITYMSFCHSIYFNILLGSFKFPTRTLLSIWVPFFSIYLFNFQFYNVNIEIVKELYIYIYILRLRKFMHFLQLSLLIKWT